MLSALVSVIRFQNFDASYVVPKFSSFIRRAASLRRIRLDVPFPVFIGTISTLRLPATHLASLRCLRSAIPPVDCISLCLLAITTNNPDFSCMGRPPTLSNGSSRLSQVPVYPSYLFAHVPTTPAGLLLLTKAQQQRGSNLGYNRSTCNDHFEVQ